MTNREPKPRKPRKDIGVRRKNTESVSISFRLDEGVPQEKEALLVLKRYREKVDENGSYFTLRTIITKALLVLREYDYPEITNRPGIDESAMVQLFDDQIRRLDATINRLNELGVSGKPAAQKKGKGKTNVNLSYLRNLQQALNGEDD